MFNQVLERFKANNDIALLNILLQQPVEIRRFPRQFVFRAYIPKDRYLFDFASMNTDWLQYDTPDDAWYFGVWVNRQQLATLAYAEGDWTLAISVSAVDFNEELRQMARFYEPAPAFTVITDQQIVQHFQDRSQFPIKFLPCL